MKVSVYTVDQETGEKSFLHQCEVEELGEGWEEIADALFTEPWVVTGGGAAPLYEIHIAP